MPVSPAIERLAAGLHRATGAAILVLPIVVVGMIAYDVASPAAVAARYPFQPVTPVRGAVLAAGLVGLLPLAATLYALIHMRGLFGLYRAGEILTPASAERIRDIGLGLFVLAVLGPVTNMIQMLILTWNNPPGQRALVLGISGATLGFVLAGALMILIGRVMSEAARMAEENRSFV